MKLSKTIEQTKSSRFIPEGKLKVAFWKTGNIPAGNGYPY
jgi:hypothetical protein